MHLRTNQKITVATTNITGNNIYNIDFVSRISLEAINL